MRYRQLGSTEIELSEIGFGAWGIGGQTPGASSYGPTTDSESIKALWTALDQGINYFDTANVYGNGNSESLIGRAFGMEREELVFSSKLGLCDFSTKIELKEPEMRASLEGSLSRLRTDFLDIIFLHEVSIEEIAQLPEILETLLKFKEEGKIRYLGVSLKNPSDASREIVRENFSVIQVNFSLLDMRLLLDGFFEQKQAAQVGLVARTPFNFGFLSNNFPEDIAFPESDHRSRWHANQVVAWARGANQVLRAAGLTDPNDLQGRIDRAINFCLSYSEVSSVIPGMLTSAEVESSVAALRAGPLPNELREAAISAYSMIERELAKSIHDIQG